MNDFKVVHFSADPWEHVCPVVRFSLPAQVTGITQIRGNDWAENQQIQIWPELIENADAVLIQRDFPRYVKSYREIIALAHRLAKPIVYEIDDLLVAMPGGHSEARHYELSRMMILSAAAEADAVTCSTENLREYFKPYNSNIQVLPNYLPDLYWKEALKNSVFSRDPDDPIVIGYVGSHSHAPDLEMIAPALVSLLEKYRGRIVFHCWGVRPPEVLFKRSDVRFFDIKIWSYAQFCQYFSKLKMDVGIAPLVDNVFNQCKSSIKYLEYSWLKIPTVYSAVGPYLAQIRDGETGFLAKNLDEWQDRLTQLIENEALRTKIGSAAYQDVDQNGFLSTHADQWARFYAQLKPVGANHLSRQTLLAFAGQAQDWHAELEERLNQEMEQVRQGKDLTRQAWEFHARAQEKINQGNITILDQQNTIRDLRSELQAMINSNTYLFAGKINSALSLFLPASSRRRRVLKSAANGLKLLSREGGASFWRRLNEKVERVRSAPNPAAGANSHIRIQSVIEPNQDHLSPAIAVVILQTPDKPPVELTTVQNWVNQQTYPADELILWDRSTTRVTSLSQGQASWHATDFAGLGKGIKSSYMVFWSEELLSVDRTYLEENLAALVSEDLLFTLNISGEIKQAAEWISQKRLPGSDQAPFMRSAIKKDCLTREGKIELGARQDRVIARILVHSTSTSADEQLPILDSLSAAGPMLLVDHRIVALTRLDLEPVNIKTSLHPIDMALNPIAAPSNQLTILVASQYFATGGAETILLKLLRNLHPDIRFIVISLDPQNSSLGSTAQEFRQITPYVYSLPEFLDPLLNLSFINYLTNRFEPDCLYIANGANWLYDVLPDYHQIHPQVSIINQVYDHQLGWINRYSRHVTAAIQAHISSNKKISQAYEKRGASPQDIFYILNGVETEEFRPDLLDQSQRIEILNRLGLPTGCKIVTFMARLHPQKRPLDFIELARRFENDPSVYFLMVGNGPLEEQVKSQIDQAGLKKLKRRDFYRPSREIFAISNVLVLPSEYEGMPMVILEALSSGVAVVTTDVGNNREILEMTQGGRTVANIGDIGALAEALRQVLATPPDPAAIRQAVIAQFSIDRMAEQYRQVFLRGKSA